MGGAVSISDNNDDMVTKLVNAQYIKSTNVERAFRAVDRANYVLNTDSAYSDSAWKSGNLHVSAPCIYAQVLEGLLLEPGLSFLNIGSGTGYLSTMAAVILGNEGINHGIELRADVIRYAKLRLKHYKRTLTFDASFFAHPLFVEGNAFLMQPPNAKYDRIYCGAAVPLSFVDMMRDHFLNVGGVMVAPIEDELVQLYKESPGRDICTSLLEVSFAHLVRRVSGENIATVGESSVSLPSHHVRSLQDQCRARVVHLVRTKLIQDKPNRGGVFAPVFAIENSLPLPPLPSDTVKKAKPGKAARERYANLLSMYQRHGRRCARPPNALRSLILDIGVELDRNMRNEMAPEGAIPASENVSALNAATTSVITASSQQVNDSTHTGNSVNLKGTVDSTSNTVLKASTTSSILDGTSSVNGFKINKRILRHYKEFLDKDDDVDMSPVTTNPGSVPSSIGGSVPRVQVTPKEADVTISETNDASLSGDSADLINKMVGEKSNGDSYTGKSSQGNGVDALMDVAFNNVVTAASNGTSNSVGGPISLTSVEGSPDHPISGVKSSDHNVTSVPSTSASIKSIDDENIPSSDEKTNAAGHSTPPTYPLLTDGHLTIKEYMTTHFISTKTMHHGYREDKRVYRVCGKTLMESHRSANVKKSEDPVNKHPSFKLHTAHQEEEEDDTSDSDSDGDTNASSNNSSDSSQEDEEEETALRSSSSSSRSERPAIIRKLTRYEDVRSVREHRRIRAFNIRRSWMRSTEVSTVSVSSNVVEVSRAVSTEEAPQIPLSESNEDKLDDVLPPKVAGSLEDNVKLVSFASTSEPSTSGLQQQETVQVACNVDLIVKNNVKEKLSVDEAMDVDESSEANVVSCVDMEVEDLNFGNNPTLFVTEAKEMCNNLSGKDDNKIQKLKLSSKTESSPRKTHSLKRSSSNSDDELEQNSSDSISLDAVDSKGRRKKAMKRQFGDGPKSSPGPNKSNEPHQPLTSDNSESTSLADSSSCSAQQLLKKVEPNKGKVDDGASTSTSLGTSRRTSARPSEGWRTVGGDTGEPSARNPEEEGDLNEARVVNRRVNNRISMISLFNRFAYSVPDRDSMYSEPLNVRDDSANDTRNENDDDDSADNVNMRDIEDAMCQRRRNLGSLRRVTAARNDVMSSSDEEPPYLKQYFKPRSTIRPARIPTRKKEKLWVRGTDGFDSYIDSKHRKCPFDRLPRERRLEIRIQDRLHRLPLPPQVLDYLLYGRWPQPPLPSTPSSAEEEKEESLC